MTQMTPVKKICVCAICIAMCYILPVAFHSVGIGSVFSPMHIPVLLCALVCGGGYGMVCGVVGPILSCVLSGMPSATALITMIPELMTYGLICGVCMHLIRTRNLFADLYICLTIAMVAGRVIGGIAKALFYLGTGDSFTIGLWATSYFVGTAPGIVAQLIVLPILVFTLMKARVIPDRYPKVA